MNYNAKSIKVLEGLTSVRKRPGMYIGNTDSGGLHQLIWEILDNSVDEVLNYHANEIKVELNTNNTIKITDNGRGIPVDLHNKYKKPAINLIFEKLHAGGKFDSDSYKTSGGLHGVGASVVNALSEKLIINTVVDNKQYLLAYNNGGKIFQKLKRVRKKLKKGSSIEFIPDKTIFNDLKFNNDKINNVVQTKAFLNANLKISFENKINNNTYKYCYKNGILDYLKYLIKNKKPLSKVVYFKDTIDNVKIEMAFVITNDFESQIYTYANNINTYEGGTHLIGFKTAYTRTINDYISKNNISKKKLIGDDLIDGLNLIISIFLNESDIQFEGQTKAKLTTIKCRKIIDNFLSVKLKKLLSENKNIALKIIRKAQRSQKIRINLKKEKDNNKSIIDTSTNSMINSKLIRCISKKANECELFLVEGDSAGGTAKNARSSFFQAILPLKGKILNVLKATMNNILANNEILSIINALNCGFDKTFNLKKLRYNRIIIMTDADSDGAHIQTLLLVFFWKYMPQLITNNHLFIANPPLYLCISKNKNKEKEHYFWDVNKFQKESKINDFSIIKRFKGLGEMNYQELKKTTMDIKNRKLINVKNVINNFDNQIIDTLMGKDSEKRSIWFKNNLDFNNNE